MDFVFKRVCEDSYAIRNAHGIRMFACNRSWWFDNFDIVRIGSAVGIRGTARKGLSKSKRYSFGIVSYLFIEPVWPTVRQPSSIDLFELETHTTLEVEHSLLHMSMHIITKSRISY